MYNEILNKVGARVLKEGGALNTENDLKKIETFLAFKFPKTHKSILSKFGGAIVFDEGAKYKPNINSPVDNSQGYQNIEVFYGVLDDDNGLISRNKMYTRQLPASIITICEAPGGNQICIEREGGKILFWHHEAADEREALFEIALSFDDFISRLEPDNESQPAISSAIDESESWLDL